MKLGRVEIVVLALAALWVTALAATAAPLDPALLQHAERRGRARVLVELERPAATSQALDDLLSGLPAGSHRVRRRLGRRPYVALELSPAGLRALGRTRGVVSLRREHRFAPTLANSGRRVQATAAHAAGLEGRGRAVVVIDSGVDVAHPFLAGSLVAEACFSDLRDCPGRASSTVRPGAAVPCDLDAECWHGTHVAGIAVGANEAFSGMAPRGQLVAVQVFSIHEGEDCFELGASSPCLLASESDMFAALEWVERLLDRLPIAAVNMSLSGEVFTSSAACDREFAGLKHVIDAMRARGVPTVIASGNGGRSDGLGSPACISTAISVGGTTRSDRVYHHGNSSPALSLLAPGVSIRSSTPGGGYDQRTGTSFAAPHVAGAWAVLTQDRPSAGVDEVLAALEETGLPVTDRRNGVTTSQIRILEAARWLEVPEPRALPALMAAFAACGVLRPPRRR